MSAPNFFVVGAAKSGTTALYHALSNHRDVFLPSVKEPHFFAYLTDPVAMGGVYPDEATARRSYGELYRDVAGEVAIGDASNSNLVVPGTANTIAAELPSARIVAILRHPVDRAFSHYRHFFVAGGEDLPDFAQAVREEKPREAAGYPLTYRYLGWGRYAEQLRPFFDRFGRERVLVHTYDDLCADPEALVRATLRFLSVEDTVALPPIGRSNELGSLPPAPASSSRGGRVGRVVRRLIGRSPESGGAAVPRRPPAGLDPSLRAELTASFSEEIEQLEELLDRDLSAWRVT